MRRASGIPAAAGGTPKEWLLPVVAKGVVESPRTLIFSMSYRSDIEPQWLPAAIQSSATAAVQDWSGEPSGSAVNGSKYSEKRDRGRASSARFASRRRAASLSSPCARKPHQRD